MDPAEALEVLAAASGFDEREPSEVQAKIWAEEMTVAGINKLVAIEAVRRYYRENPDGRVRPSHLPKYAHQIRRELEQQARAREIEERRQYVIGQYKGGPHWFKPAGDGTCVTCGQPDEGNSKHLRLRSNSHEGLLAELRKRLPAGDNAFRDQLAGRMRDKRSLPGE